jgi:hypothetical protein
VKQVTIPITGVLVSMLTEHLGPDEALWAEWLEQFLRDSEETIEYALAYEEEGREPEWNAAEAAWPIFF